ncbi:MAG: hypothetical protein NZL96_03845 [Patescibacteria group bacterium]|nr:hypothetical protein [Patescibacteria group bacterium]
MNRGLIFFTFLLIFFTYFIISRGLSFFYSDEHGCIGRSHYFKLLVERDFKNPFFIDFYGFDQPKLGNYLYGSLLYVDYLLSKNSNNYSDFVEYLIYHGIIEIDYENYKKYSDFIKKIGYSPIDYSQYPIEFENFIDTYGEKGRRVVELIKKARLLSVLFSSLNFLVVFYLYRKITNSLWFSYCGALFYSFNNLIIKYNLRAFSEPIFIFLFNVFILVFLQLYNSIG